MFTGTFPGGGGIQMPGGLPGGIFKVGTHDGTSPCDKSLQQVTGTSRRD